MSAPLTPLELRLEVSKRISNLQLNYLKRLGDRRSIIERYCGGEAELHIHIAMNRMMCATYRFGNCGERDGIRFVEPMGKMDGPATFDVCEFPVLIWIGNVSEGPRPVTSCVRLQPLDCCYMSGVDALEPARLNTTIKSLFGVFDGELRHFLLAAGIQLCEFKDEIIERVPEVVCDLADENADDKGRPDTPACVHDLIMRKLWLELKDDSILLFVEPLVDPALQISKVFLCPTYSFERAVEYVRGHAIFPP